MKWMHRLMTGVDVKSMLDQLENHPSLWDQNRLRTTFENSPHAAVSDIWLRFNEVQEDPTLIMDDHESVDYPAYDVLRRFRRTVMAIFAYVGGERLGRVMITKLPPGEWITTHVDSGSHATYYDRFHLCLQAGPGTVFRCEDEKVEMRPGELWWVQNSVEHDVYNGSDTPRIHLIVDARCKDWFSAVYAPESCG